MLSNKIFRWVWRVNGLFILLGSLLIVATVSIEFFGRSARSVPEPVVTSIAEDPQGLERWVLGRSESVSGSSYLYIPLESEKKDFEYKARRSSSSYDMFSSNYLEAFSKNVLFVNRQSEEMKWLFDGVDQFVLSINQLPQRSRFRAADDVATRYMFYTVVDQDTNNDGLVSSDDNRSLAVSKYDGSDYRVILQGYERVLSRELDDNDELSIVYQQSGIGYLAKYTLSPFLLVSKTELPRIESQ